MSTAWVWWGLESERWRHKGEMRGGDLPQCHQHKVDLQALGERGQGGQTAGEQIRE
jgi:hypothetical protein